MADLARSAGLSDLENQERSDCLTVRVQHSDSVAVRPNGNDLIEREYAILPMLERSEEGLPLRGIHARLPLRIMKSMVRGLGGMQDVDRSCHGLGATARWNVFAAAKEFTPRV